MEDADSPKWVGKEVKDIYGRRLGRAVGMIFDIGGKITTIGVEDGHLLIKIDPDRITSEGEELVVIPEWMFESKNVGLDHGGLMKRFSALSLMVNEKRISERLSKDVFAKLSSVQKSHEEVLAKTMSRLEDLARADAEIDDFVSLVTLQHVAGEMSGESFDFTVAECEKIKGMNGREIIDIRRTLGMATGEQSVADPGDDPSPGSGVGDRPDQGTSAPEQNATRERMLSTSYMGTRQPDTASGVPWGRDASEERVQPAAIPLFGRRGPALREREDFMIRHENLLEAPIRPKKPDAKNARISASAGPPSASSSQAHDVAGSATAEVKRPSVGMEGDQRPTLGQKVSAWVFAKIVDLEALDVRPGDYGSYRSPEKEPD